MSRDDWRFYPAQWAEHVDGYTHRRAVEAAARKHGRALGCSFLVLLARRLRVVDVRDGMTLDGATAWALVERWSVEGRVKEAA